MADFDAKLAAAEALWARGPRTFKLGGLYGVTKDGGAVNYPGQKLPVSRSLPYDNREGVPATLDGHQVRKHADGTYSTLGRRPIVRNRDEMKKHAERSGSIVDN